MTTDPLLAERVTRLELQLKNAQKAISTAYMQAPEGTATWLDRCAWAAMQGLLAGLEGSKQMWEARSVAETAYRVADALLAEKRKREGAP